MALIRIEQHDGVALLTLADPARRNALSLELARELADAVTRLAISRDVRALVVTGAPPAFSAGAHLDDLVGADAERLQAIYQGFLSVAAFPLPTFAAVNGPAVGAGLNLALACDVRVAGESARFESRFSDLSLHPGGGHTWMLQRLLGPQGAAAVVLAGETLDGRAAERHGLAWRCVDDEDLVGETLRLAGRAASNSRDLLTRLTATVRAMATVHTHQEAVRVELEQQLWSIRQAPFLERLRALRQSISGKRSRR